MGSLKHTKWVAMFRLGAAPTQKMWGIFHAFCAHSSHLNNPKQSLNFLKRSFCKQTTVSSLNFSKEESFRLRETTLTNERLPCKHINKMSVGRKSFKRCQYQQTSQVFHAFCAHASPAPNPKERKQRLNSLEFIFPNQVSMLSFSSATCKVRFIPLHFSLRLSYPYSFLNSFIIFGFSISFLLLLSIDDSSFSMPSWFCMESV